jgi:hypothetical protein
MNPTFIIGCLARVLATQSGAPLASITIVPATRATPRPGISARSCPVPHGLHAALFNGGMPNSQIARIAGRAVLAPALPVLLGGAPAARQAATSPA